MAGSRVIGEPTKGGIIPRFVAAFQGPAVLIDSARMRALHNRISKRAGRAAMLIHWKEHIPLHFQRGNRQKYDHQPRTAKTRAIKRARFGSINDLVKSGQTRDQMTTLFSRIRAGGAAANPQGNGVMKITMELRFPFPVSLTRTGRGVTPQQMAKEIAAWTGPEIVRIAAEYRDIYAAELGEALANSPRIRKKLTSAGVL